MSAVQNSTKVQNKTKMVSFVLFEALELLELEALDYQFSRFDR